jgi:UDP-N-acetylmuramoyl-tripeptide--D-alanyl-D-alanine ligase
MLRVALPGQVHAAHASYNNHWGVPLTLARLPAEASFCVAEIGTNHPGEIAPLAALVRPDVALITAIGTAHAGPMGGPEAIAREKASIFQSLQAGGFAIIPEEAPFEAILNDAVPRDVQRLAFGSSRNSHAHLLTTDPSGGILRVSAKIGPRPIEFKLATLGRHMALNALAALTVCDALGVDVEAAAARIEAFRPGSGRGLMRPLLNGQAVLLDESYNASGASVRAALEVLALTDAVRRIAVLGDMLELGEWAEPEHRALAEPAAASADLVFCCGPWSRALFDALPARRRGIWAPDAASLAGEVAAVVQPGDAVLVKGSNGSRMRVVVDALVGNA